MAETKLEFADQASLKDALSKLETSSPVAADDFSVPTGFEQGARKTIRDRLDGQIPLQRNLLLGLIIGLTLLSFGLLAGVIIFLLWKRIGTPEYVGISDGIITILATGVFAELIGLIGVLAAFVWRNPE